MTRKPELIILANEVTSDHQLWLNACEKRSSEVNYQVVDLTRHDWLECIIAKKPDYLLVKPGGLTSRYKKLYDERLSILVNWCNLKAFPSLNEVLIHENKAFQAYWLRANALPHPVTTVFYRKDEADLFAASTQWPVVTKLNIGSSGKGVEIIRDRNSFERYVSDIFSAGRRSRTGPDLGKGRWLTRAVKVFSDPHLLKERMTKYKAIYNEVQKGFMMVQEYIPHDYEWRAVRIGDSFFAHKKMKVNDKASGTLIKEYCRPPLSLLSFVREITDRFGFYSMSVDLFEPEKDSYLINEMQCIFGQSDPYQMAIDGVPGRYVFVNNEWLFETGDFNTNQCFDLRLDHVLEMISAE